MTEGSGSAVGTAKPPGSTGETELARQQSTKSAKQKNGAMKGGSILKKESSYASAAKAKSASEASNGAKALSFADDHGDALTEENFVNQLHYPQMKADGNDPKGCCTIS